MYTGHRDIQKRKHGAKVDGEVEYKVAAKGRRRGRGSGALGEERRGGGTLAKGGKDMNGRRDGDDWEKRARKEQSCVWNPIENQPRIPTHDPAWTRLISEIGNLNRLWNINSRELQ